MTGLERLRELSGELHSALLSDIADQIEREHAQTCEDHEKQQEIIRDLQRERDEALREAKWVRGHGGLDVVKSRDELVTYIIGWLRDISSVPKEHYNDLDWMIADVDRRLMPPGMEWLLEVWPRWSNGEYCRFGDWWTADRYGDHEPRQLRRLVIYTPELLDEWEQGDGESYGYEWDFTRPSEVDYRPDKVEPSDSWEQLEEDYTISERRYYATHIGHDVGLMDDAEIHEAVSRDLVRRAKALAERERGE